MKTTVKIVGLYVFCFFFGLLVASLPVLAKETKQCPRGREAVWVQHSETAGYYTCRPIKVEVCRTVKFNGITEQRCYKALPKTWHRTSEPPKKHERGRKKMTYNELLSSIEAKKADDSGLSEAEQLILAYEAGEKRRKATK
jgi:hypothetical protein